MVCISWQDRVPRRPVRNLLNRFALLQCAILICIGFVSFCFGSAPANAASITLGDYTITLQSTLGYTVGERTAPVDHKTAALNSDDGDRNFRTGIVENRFQTLEQFQISNGSYGFRASALAWLDTTYLQDNKNNSPNTFNAYGVGRNGFPSATIANDGRRIEPLAAFIYGAESFDSGNQTLSWQFGRQTITWGQSLFSLDGISGLQAPADLNQAKLLPNPQAQALFLPTGAISASYDFGSGVSADAYWQFEYEPDILPGVGSYFSTSDAVGPGGQRLLATPINAGAASIYRAPDIRPANGLNQFGFDAHKTFGASDVALYFLRGIPKTPLVYTELTGKPTPNPNGPKVGQYNVVYAQPVNAFAVSGSTLLWNANVAGEISGRTNQPLVSKASYTPADPANYNHPLYAIGDVLDAQLSAIYVAPPMPLLTNGATIQTELTLNKVLSVTKNKAALVPGNTSEGGSFEIVCSPNWFPRADVEILTPVGWTTTFLGDSQYDGSAAGNSTYNIGIQAIYKANLTVGVNYQRYAGTPARQSTLDRDFVTFYIQRTF